MTCARHGEVWRLARKFHEVYYVCLALPLMRSAPSGD